MKGDRPPASGLKLERNGGGERGAVFSPGKGEESGQGLAVRVVGAWVRHKSLPNFIGSGQEQDLQRLADKLGRFPPEQSGTNRLRGNDDAGLVNRHGAPTLFKLGRRCAGGLAGSRHSRGLRVRKGRQGGAGTLISA